MKKTIHKNIDSDVILFSDCLKKEYDNRNKMDMFINVFYGEDGSLNPVYKIISFFFPVFGIKCFFDLKTQIYTDIYFYNPTWIYYYLYKYSQKSKIIYRWHFIFDGSANYVQKSPKYIPRYSDNNILGRLLNRVDVCKYGYMQYDAQLIDMYVWGKELISVSKQYDVIEIPMINWEYKEIEKVNEIFNVANDHIDKKLIYLDVISTDEGLYREQEITKVFRLIDQIVEEKNYVIKKHPRTPESKYAKLGKQSLIIDNDAPWELLYINGFLNNCSIIGFHSTSTYLSSVISKENLPVYDLSKYMINKSSMYRDADIKLIGQIEKNICKYNPNYYFVKDEDDLIKILNIIKEEMRKRC